MPATDAEITLSFDHRTIDGGGAGRLLGRHRSRSIESVVREVPVPAVPELPAPQALAERAHLSLRESEVVLLVARGQADKEIARALGISFTTVRYHLENAFRKLGVQGRHKLALRLREFA